MRHTLGLPVGAVPLKKLKEIGGRLRLLL